MTTLENPVYLHCRKCLAAGLSARYEICTDGRYIQVWCQTCNSQVTTLELKPRPTTESEGKDE